MFPLCTIIYETEVGRDVRVLRNILSWSVVVLTSWFASDKLDNSYKRYIIYNMESLARPNNTFELIDLTFKICPQGAWLLQGVCFKEPNNRILTKSLQEKLFFDSQLLDCNLLPYIVHKITMTKTSKAK